MALTAARNRDLIRELMLRLEAMPMASLRPYDIEMDDPILTVDGFSIDDIRYHIRLLYQAGFIDGPASQPLDGSLIFSGFTWQGCEFLDSVRDNAIWSKTKAAAAKVGGASLAVLAELAKAVAKQHLGLTP